MVNAIFFKKISFIGTYTCFEFCTYVLFDCLSPFYVLCHVCSSFMEEIKNTTTTFWEIIIIIIIIISIFKEDNVFSITASLQYGPPVNTDIDYYRTFFGLVNFCKCCEVSGAIFC